VVDEYPSLTVVTLSGNSVSILSSTQFNESEEALSCVRCEEEGEQVTWWVNQVLTQVLECESCSRL